MLTVEFLIFIRKIKMFDRIIQNKTDFEGGQLYHNTRWLGWEDSNLRMAESKSAALPLGYTPRFVKASFKGVIRFRKEEK